MDYKLLSNKNFNELKSNLNIFLYLICLIIFIYMYHELIILNLFIYLENYYYL